MEKRISGHAVATRSRQARRPASAKKQIKTAISVVLLSVLTVVSIATVYLVILLIQESRSLPSLADIGNYKPSEGTKIFYSDGSLMAVLSNENRRPVKLEEIDKKLQQATIAIEDSRFYEHRGIDYHGIARALYKNVTGGDLHAQGASTITQQLARNINELGLTKRKRLTRKVREAILAVRIEQSFSKDEILELYLNQTYYGAGAHGVEAAALTYFHKNAKKLTLGQAAMLAALPQRPVYFSDPKHLDVLYRRRDSVLQRMAETGKITSAESEKARQEKIKLYKPEFNGTRVLGAPYFVNWVISQLVNDSQSEQGYGADAVFSGWSIYTTLDPKIQQFAESTLKEGIHHYGEEANQGALICVDPKTGYVRAMVGGLDYKKDQFNVVVQGKRQPGSAFKPIVYTAGIDTDTCNLDKSYVDDPFFEGHKTGPGAWLPKNYKGKYSHKSMRVLTAIEFSINTVAVKVAVDTGLKTVIDYAHRMGISTEIPPYAPIALGAAAVRPIELCSAYTVFANGGKRAVPMGITKVVDQNGDTIDERQPQLVDTSIRPETMEAMNTALREVVLHGTGTMAAEVPDARGKTGTTSDSRDAWFAGYTPDLVTILWVARENRTKSGKLDRKEPYKEMPGATGGHLCAPIWRDFMLKAVPIQQAANKKANQTPAKPFPAAPVAAAKPKKEPIKSIGPEQQPAGKDTTATPDGEPIQPAGNPDTSVTGGPAAPPSTSVPPSVVAPLPRNGDDNQASATQPSGRTSSSAVRRTTDSLSSARPRISEPSGRIAAPAIPHSDPGDEMITVNLCADSLRRANKWCDSTVQRRMRKRDIPGFCRVHKPPPGEDDR